MDIKEIKKEVKKEKELLRKNIACLIDEFVDNTGIQVEIVRYLMPEVFGTFSKTYQDVYIKLEQIF